MGGFSSRPKGKNQVTEVDKAVLSLKTQRRKLTDYQKRTQAMVDKEQEAVRRWIANGDKQMAVLALKKKKIQEDALHKANDWILKLEQQLVELDTAKHQSHVVESLKVGQAAMAALQKELKLEDVEKLMEDTEDSKAHLQEVQAILDSHLSPEEEEAILKEMEELERELGITEEKPSISTPPAATSVAPQMPSVPSHKVVLKDTEGQADVEAEQEEEETVDRGKEAPILA